MKIELQVMRNTIDLSKTKQVDGVKLEEFSAAG